MKKILITGGNGKIGRYFIKNYHNNFSVSVADKQIELGIFKDSVRLTTCDLNDFSRCKAICRDMDVVIHLAGIVDPISESEEILYTNIKTTQNIFRAAVEAKCKKLIYASSAQVIENYPIDVQVKTNQIVKPKNMYGVSKSCGEALAAYYHYNKGIPVICLRIGAYEFPEDFTEMNTRDLSAYLHPDDFNQLLFACIEKENVDFEILNAISDNRYKRLDITKTIEKVGYEPKADSFELFNLKKE